jgi:long-chain acyl-CoA synthetase
MKMTDAPTIADLLQERIAQTPHETAFQVLRRATWSPVTWAEHGQRIYQLAQGLRDIDLGPGSRVAIMAKTSLEWECVQMAILINSGVVVGIDAHDTAENIEHIMRTADITGLIVESPTLLDKIDPQVRQRLSFIVTMEAPAPTQSGIYALQELFKTEASPRTSQKPAPDSPATIIFTSGTTGQPKGIQYTHSQMMLASQSIVTAFAGISPGWRLACWLPLSNLFQRMLNLCAMQIGAQTYVVSDPRQIMTLLPSINPHVFIGVPRFYEKLYAGMVQKISERGGMTRLLFRSAMFVGDIHARSLRRNSVPGLPTRWLNAAFDGLILSRLRAVLGGSIQFMISGSAPMPLWLLEKFHAMGLLILEAYGISENIVPVALNRPEAYRFGSVGLPLPENEVKLADDGEVLVKGLGVCLQYYGVENSPNSEDNSGLHVQGHLATGDLGKMDSDGFLFLTGRKSEIFKTSTGRRIAPARIEACLCQSQYVDQAMVTGQGRKFVVAVATLTEEGDKLIEAAPLAAQNAASHGPERIAEDLSRLTAELPAYQRPAGFVFTRRPFSIAEGELTANLKLKRSKIAARYEDALLQLYAKAESAHGNGIRVQKLTDEITLVTL